MKSHSDSIYQVISARLAINHSHAYSAKSHSE